MRLFVGWPLPSEWSDELLGTVGSLRATLPPASWTRGNLHLTFAFLGETSAELVEPLGSSLTEAMSPLESIEVMRGAAGFFPGQRRPRIFWIGLEPLPPLVRVAAAVRAALRSVGAGFDEKRFVPHVTLARIRGSWSASDCAAAREMLERKYVSPAVMSEVVLFESRPGSHGAVHTPLLRAPLIRRA